LANCLVVLAKHAAFQNAIALHGANHPDAIVQTLKDTPFFMEEMMELVPDATIIEEKIRVIINQKNRKGEKEKQEKQINPKQEKENQEKEEETIQTKLHRQYIPWNLKNTTWLTTTTREQNMDAFVETLDRTYQAILPMNPTPTQNEVHVIGCPSIRMCFFIGDDEYEMFY